MICFNKVELIGNLGRDPRVKTFNDGSKAADFSVATSRKKRLADASSYEVETTWHTVVAYGQLASFADQYLNKGTLVLIEGSIRNREYTNADGVKVSVTEIVANNIQKLDPRSHNDADVAEEQERRYGRLPGRARAEAEAQEAPGGTEDDGDLTF